MYRAVTWAVLRAGVDPQATPTAVAKVAAEGDARQSARTRPHRTSPLDGVAVDGEIRGPEVTAAVSAVSAVPAVRAAAGRPAAAIIAAAARTGSWSRAATSARWWRPTPT